MTLRIGSLCTGYGGLTLATEEVTGGETVWVSDIDKGARKVLDWWFPGVPNLGDMTQVDWTQVPPVDVLDGGTPCQDLSHAGKRAGMTEGSRSNLWVSMREAIAALRPSLVIWENVGGAYSAGADCELEPDAGLLGDGPGRPALRALGRVLGDLASLGYDAEWHGLRAADVGAPHGRLRVFLAAYPIGGGRHGWTPDTKREQVGRVATAWRGEGSPLLTPRTSDTNGAGTHGAGGIDLRTAVTLLPTPAVNDMGEGKTPDTWDAWTDRMQAAHGNGNGHGKSLAIEAQRLLGTPTATMSERSEEFASPGHNPAEFAAQYDGTWGDYAAAIHRWETLTRPAPPPTQPSTKGTPQLSPAFAEWMMGLPHGWITQVPGITRNEALKLAGNGVVPQQAEAALRLMLTRATP